VAEAALQGRFLDIPGIYVRVKRKKGEKYNSRNAEQETEFKEFSS